MLNFEYKESYQYLTNVMLNVTDDCNLACKYCFVEQNPHYMSLTTAKDIIDWMYQNFQKKQQLNINIQKCELNFFGGEPMLCYDSIIVPLINYIELTYPNIFNFGMTTNGTLLNEERINFLKKHHVSLLLSIDGAEITQNFNRPCKNGKNSYNLIYNNIEYLLKNYPNLTFRSTIYPATVQYLFENYKHAESLGFKNYEMIPDERHEYQWTEEKKDILQQEINKIYFYRLEQICHGIKPIYCKKINEMSYYTIELIQKNKKFFSKEKNLTVERCGLGTTFGAIGWDGSIYGCQEQVSKDIKNIFYIGNIFENGIDINKHKKLLSFYYNNIKNKMQDKEECNNCILSPLCLINQTVCPSSNYDINNNMYSINNFHCQYLKMHYKNIYLLLYSILKINDKDIQQYLLQTILN